MLGNVKREKGKKGNILSTDTLKKKKKKYLSRVTYYCTSLLYRPPGEVSHVTPRLLSSQHIEFIAVRLGTRHLPNYRSVQDL